MHKGYLFCAESVFLEEIGMKKGLFSIIITSGVILSVLFLSINPAKTSYAAEEPGDGITVDSEYIIPDSCGFSTYYVVVATNNTGKDISVKADFVAKDNDGNSLYKVNDGQEAVRDGQQFIIYGQFANSRIEGVSDYDYSFEVSPSDRCAYNSVKLDAERKDDVLKVSATNYSDKDLQGVGVRTVFLKGGEAIAFDTVNIADEGTAFHGGSSNSQEVGMFAGDYDDYLVTYTSVE